MSSRTRPHCFELTSAQLADRQRSVARFTCVACGMHEDVTLKSGDLNPEGICNHMKNKGWQAPVADASRVLCPRCLTRRKGRNDVNSELRSLEAKMAATTPLAVPTAVVPLREPTADQRRLIRKLLDGHFDEQDGCYDSDYSDDRIASEAAVPRAVVERLRESAYGPIRLTKEMLEIRSRQQALRAKVSDIEAAANSLSEQLRKDIAELRAEIAALEVRLTKAAA